MHAYVSIYAIFFINDPAPAEIYTLSLHDALPIYDGRRAHLFNSKSRSAIEQTSASSFVGSAGSSGSQPHNCLPFDVETFIIVVRRAQIQSVSGKLDLVDRKRAFPTDVSWKGHTLAI